MERRKFIRQSGLGTLSALGLGSMNILNAKAGSEHSPLPELPGADAVRIAVVQQEGNPGKVEENREKALGFARQALEKNADAILFHEEMLVGYVENLKELAEEANGPTTKAFMDLLKGSEAKVIYGLTERHGDDCYISAPIVSANGLVDNYRKTHLWWRAEGLRHEPAFYKAGNRLVTFDVKGHKCGIMICYDGDFMEMTRSYANMGCNILFWMNNRRSRGNKEVRNLAWRNSMIMPTTCCCGLNERAQLCEGGSNITGPEGEVMGEIWDKEGLVIADVYPGKVPELRKNNPHFTGHRGDLYYYG